MLRGAAANWSAPGAIGSVTPNSGVFTTLAITAGAIISGTYTPTLTNATNVASSSATLANYIRVGNQVTVAGGLTIDPTAASASTVLRISLPFASTMGSAADAAGVASCISVFGLTGGIQGSVGNGVAALTFIADATAGNVSWTYTFTYIVH
jgi:hypothetical protein